MNTAPVELIAFVEREQPRLVRAVELLLGDHAVAEEIAQETLLRAASRWEQLERMESPGGWAHRVAINLATSQLRRRKLERRARARLLPDTVTSPTDTATVLAVREALSQLPERTRRVLVLRHVLDWSAPQIADLDGSSTEAVRQQLHRAREALRDRLGPSIHIDVEETSDAP